jgi:hypothetical protein
MRTLATWLFLLAVIGQPMLARGAEPACRVALDRLSAEWDAAGYVAPSKPSQIAVLGRDGRTASGSEVSYMRTQLGLAAKDCRAGDDQGALSHIAIVHRLLGSAL